MTLYVHEASFSFFSVKIKDPTESWQSDKFVVN